MYICHHVCSSMHDIKNLHRLVAKPITEFVFNDIHALVAAGFQSFSLLKNYGLASQYSSYTQLCKTYYNFEIIIKGICYCMIIKILSYYQNTTACDITVLYEFYNTLYNLTESTHVSYKSVSITADILYGLEYWLQQEQ